MESMNNTLFYVSQRNYVLLTQLIYTPTKIRRYNLKGTNVFRVGFKQYIYFKLEKNNRLMCQCFEFSFRGLLNINLVFSEDYLHLVN